MILRNDYDIPPSFQAICRDTPMEGGQIRTHSPCDIERGAQSKKVIEAHFLKQAAQSGLVDS